MRAAVFCVCATLVACAGPRITVDSLPSQAKLYVNGHVAGRTPKRIAAAFYGGYRFEAELDPTLTSVSRHADETIDVREPVTPWIFPLDFFFELLLAPFSDREVQVTLALVVDDRVAPAPAPAPASRPASAPAGHDALLGRVRSLGLSR